MYFVYSSVIDALSMVVLIMFCAGPIVGDQHRGWYAGCGEGKLPEDPGGVNSQHTWLHAEGGGVLRLDQRYVVC